MIVMFIHMIVITCAHNICILDVVVVSSRANICSNSGSSSDCRNRDNYNRKWQ